MKQIWNYLRKSPLLRMSCGLLLVVALMNAFSFVDPFSFAYAEADEAMLRSFQKIASVLVNISVYVALVTIGTIGQFMGNELIAGDKMLEIITPMWVLIRNLVNIGAILIIIFIALSNMFTFGSGNWSIKEKLPKLILALVAVNFSMVFVKVALDAVYVGTVAIYTVSDSAIAKITGEDGSLRDVLLSGGRCFEGDKDCEKVKEESESNGDAEHFAEAINKVLCPSVQPDGTGAKASDCLVFINRKTGEDEFSDIPPRQAAEDGRPGENLFGAFANYVMYLELLPTALTNIEKDIDDKDGGSLWVLITSTLFSMIMGIAYSFGFIAILIALIARTVFMWFILILSPGIIAAQIMGIEAGGIWEKMIKQLIIPLKIATILVISFLMIGQLASLGDATVIENSKIVVIGPGLNKMGASVFAMVWKIMTVFIFWVGIWWALDDNLAKGMTDKIKAGAEGLGGMALNGIKAAPIMPIPTGSGKSEKVGIGSLMSLPTLLNRQISKAIEKDQSAITGIFNGEAAKQQQEISRDLEKIEDNTKGLLSGGGSLNEGLGQALPSLHHEDAQERLVTAIESSAKANSKNVDIVKLKEKLKLITAEMTPSQRAEAVKVAFEKAGIGQMVNVTEIEQSAKRKSDAEQRDSNNADSSNTTQQPQTQTPQSGNGAQREQEFKPVDVEITGAGGIIKVEQESEYKIEIIETKSGEIKANFDKIKDKIFIPDDVDASSIDFDSLKDEGSGKFTLELKPKPNTN